MIRRGVVLLAVWGMCVYSTANAADLPSIAVKKITTPVKNAPKLQKRTAKLRRVVVLKPSTPKTVVKAPKVPLDPVGVEMNLVWALEPLVANSDGAKREDSASVEANLVVTDPGRVSRSKMIIQLSGHVVKTARTTARIDIRIGNSHRIVSWNADEVQSGKFDISLDEPISDGELPGYFPVSALAFVTKDGKDGAAMISLEKVVVKVGKIQRIATKKYPATDEVTGSLSTN